MGDEDDWVTEVCDNIKELAEKIKRGDLIPVTKVAFCDCNGGWCDKCKGKSVIAWEGFMNEWDQHARDAGEGEKQ